MRRFVLIFLLLFLTVSVPVLAQGGPGEPTPTSHPWPTPTDSLPICTSTPDPTRPTPWPTFIIPTTVFTTPFPATLTPTPGPSPTPTPSPSPSPTSAPTFWLGDPLTLTLAGFSDRGDGTWARFDLPLSRSDDTVGYVVVSAGVSGDVHEAKLSSRCCDISECPPHTCLPYASQRFYYSGSYLIHCAADDYMTYSRFDICAMVAPGVSDIRRANWQPLLGIFTISDELWVYRVEEPYCSKENVCFGSSFVQVRLIHYGLEPLPTPTPSPSPTPAPGTPTPGPCRLPGEYPAEPPAWFNPPYIVPGDCYRVVPALSLEPYGVPFSVPATEICVDYLEFYAYIFNLNLVSVFSLIVSFYSLYLIVDTMRAGH